MAFLAVNGYELPVPKRGVSIVVTTVVDSARNADGVVVGQKVGRDQYKIDGLEWPVLNAETWQTLLYSMKDFFFPVTFPDPVSGEMTTIRMYCGDRTAEPYWIDDDGNPTLYINCKVNLIDTGED